MKRRRNKIPIHQNTIIQAAVDADTNPLFLFTLIFIPYL
jgi:hypothetical protein